MTTEKIKEKLTELYPRYGQWSDEDKRTLRQIIRILGIKHSFKSGCMSCFDDAYILAKNALELSTADLIENPNARTYTFTQDNPVEWHGVFGVIYLDWNTPDETIERFISMFPNQSYFIKNE